MDTVKSSITDVLNDNISFDILEKEYIEKGYGNVFDIHKNVNQRYGEYPYSMHLICALKIAEQWVNKYLDEFGDNDTITRNSVLLAVAMHDTIEDCRMTYNDVKNFVKNHYPHAYPKLVADIVYAVTNEKGKTRDERANDKYYKELKNQPYASFIKICDRHANMKYSWFTNSPMLEKYKKERYEFTDNFWGTNSVLNQMLRDMEIY